MTTDDLVTTTSLLVAALEKSLAHRSTTVIGGALSALSAVRNETMLEVRAATEPPARLDVSPTNTQEIAGRPTSTRSSRPSLADRPDNDFMKGKR